MQTETRSLLGLLLWVSLAYPQISHCVNKACGFMSNPSHNLHYTHNLDGEPPPPVVKPSKKGPTAAKVLTTKEKQDFLLLVGL